MPRKTVVNLETGDASVVVDPITVEEESKTSVTVTWGNQSRVYSKEVHGKEFRDLAKQFVEKHGGKMK
jgi:hypothetical protein